MAQPIKQFMTLQGNRAGEEIRVEVSEWKGSRRLDLRTWYTDREGELKPSRQGITLTGADVWKLIEAGVLEKAHALLTNGEAPKSKKTAKPKRKAKAKSK